MHNSNTFGAWTTHGHTWSHKSHYDPDLGEVTTFFPYSIIRRAPPLARSFPLPTPVLYPVDPPPPSHFPLRFFNPLKEIKEFKKKENRANQPRFVFFIRDEQLCASIIVKGVLLQL